MYQLKKIIQILISSSSFLPVFLYAEPLVTCGNSTGDMCGYQDLVQLGKNILDFIVVLSIPIAAIGFSYAGYLYLTAGIEGEGNLKKAKDIFTKIFIGFVLIISAWLIVYTITSTLLDENQYEVFLTE